MRPTIHASDLRSYKNCARAAGFSSLLWRGLTPNNVYGPFYVGRVVHSALEFYYHGVSFDHAIKMAMNTEQEATTDYNDDDAAWILEEYDELVLGILNHYREWLSSDAHLTHPWSDDKLQFLELEPEFEIPYEDLFDWKRLPEANVGGRFDGIVRRRDDGTLWLFETKTAASIEALQAHLPFDEQAGLYILAAEHLLGEQFQGVIYNILRKKVPTVPQVLKAGGLSKRVLDTTEEVYLRAAMDAHPDLNLSEIKSLYADVLLELRTKGNTFFSRTVVRRTPEEIKNIGRNLIKMGFRMLSERAFIPSPEMLKCDRCPFKGPCLATTRGEEPDLTEYRLRTDRIYRPKNAYGYYLIPVRDDRIHVWKDGVRLYVVSDWEQAVDRAVYHALAQGDERLARDLRSALWQNQ